MEEWVGKRMIRLGEGKFEEGICEEWELDDCGYWYMVNGEWSTGWFPDTEEARKYLNDWIKATAKKSPEEQLEEIIEEDEDVRD